MMSVNASNRIKGRQRGFTIVELLATMVLTLFLMVGVIDVFKTNMRSGRFLDNSASLVVNGQYALKKIAMLEAMAAGRAVVSSSLSAMPEFGGDAVVYFNPREPEDFAEKVGKLMDDPTALRVLGQRAANHALRYDWEVTAAATWRAILGVTA